jgi:hypothetical protein
VDVPSALASLALAATPRDDQERREIERDRQRLREDDTRRNKSIRKALRKALSSVPSFDLPTVVMGMPGSSGRWWPPQARCRPGSRLG